MPLYLQHKGFTLIEVLISLAILSIALTAIIKSTSQTIQHTVYLQEKIMAAWVGEKMMNDIRAHLVQVPKAPDILEDQCIMLGKNWLEKATLKTTPNPQIQEINVEIFLKKDQPSLSHLVGYLH